MDLIHSLLEVLIIMSNSSRKYCRARGLPPSLHKKIYMEILKISKFWPPLPKSHMWGKDEEGQDFLLPRIITPGVEYPHGLFESAQIQAGEIVYPERVDSSKGPKFFFKGVQCHFEKKDVIEWEECPPFRIRAYFVQFQLHKGDILHLLLSPIQDTTDMGVILDMESNPYVWIQVNGKVTEHWSLDSICTLKEWGTYLFTLSEEAHRKIFGVHSEMGDMRVLQNFHNLLEDVKRII